MALQIAKGVSFPKDAITQTYAVLGKRGMGKTNTAVVMAEEFLTARHQIVVVDPTDVWYGLKSSSTGDSEGFPLVVFGGNHADLPLLPESGKVLADFIIESGHSVILSTRLLSKTKQRRVVADVFERLYELKGLPQHKSPLHVFLDEANRFIPQMMRKDESDAARTIGALADVTLQGRVDGFGVTVIAQRSANINKDILSQCEVLIAHQTSGKHDRDAIKAWVEANADVDKLDEFMRNLVSLDRGQVWVWSATWLKMLKLADVRPRFTFDSSATPTGSKRRTEPRRVAHVDLKALEHRMQETVAAAKANDPAALKQRIKELEAEVLQKPKTVAAPARAAAPVGLSEKDASNRVREAVQHRDQEWSQPFNTLESRLTQVMKVVAKVGEHLTKAVNELNLRPMDTAERPAKFKVPEYKAPDLVVSPPSGVVTRRASSVVPPVGDYSDNGSLPKGERRVLIALAQRQEEPAKRTELTVITGYTQQTRDKYLLSLHNKGYVVAERRQDVSITQAGIDALGDDYEELPTGDALLQHWLSTLPTGEAAILKVVCDHHPHGCSRQHISDVTGYTQQTRDKYILSLSALVLVSAPRRRDVTAHDKLFS